MAPCHPRYEHSQDNLFSPRGKKKILNYFISKIKIFFYLTGVIKIPGATSLRVVFEQGCSTERRNDPLTIQDGSGRVLATRSGREATDWAQEITANCMYFSNVCVFSLST